jgi:hypothetical protein
VRISEVQISNKNTLFDEDGDSSDWIEIQNTSASPQDLTGWVLVHNELDVWAFPAVTLQPREYRLIYASGKDRAEPEKPLHTSFQLKEGEAVRLSEGTENDSSEPIQLPNVPRDASYGVNDASEAVPLISRDAALQWVWQDVGNATASPAWAARKYSTSSWRRGQNGLLWRRIRSGLSLSVHTMARVPESGRELAQMLRRPSEIPVLATQSASVMNFSNGEATAKLRWSRDKPLPRPSGVVPTAALLYQASGNLYFSAAGKWTLAVSMAQSDKTNPYRLAIGETVFTSESGGGGIIIDPFIDPKVKAPDPAKRVIIGPPGGGGAGFHTLNIPKPGYYPIQLSWVQNPAAAQALELSAAPGEHADYTSAFRLVGDSRRPTRQEGAAEPSWPVGTLASTGKANNATALITRIPFDAPTDGPARLQLRVLHTDGFRAWIDGKLVAEVNAPLPQKLASKQRSSAERQRETILDLPMSTADLVAPLTGHVLTVQALAGPQQRSLMYQHVQLLAKKGAARETLAFFNEPTPGLPNGDGLGGPSPEPDVSQPRGLYSQPFSLTLTSPSPTAQIFYSTDGNPPRMDRGTLYRGPISIDKTTVVQAFAIEPGRLPSHSILHTYVLTHNQGQQSADVLPQRWAERQADYTFNTENPPDAANLSGSLQSLPTLSVVLPTEDLFGEQGLHSHPEFRGRSSAYPASVEWLYPASGKHSREAAEIRIKGEAGRSLVKHGFRLDFGGGRGDLRRPALGDSDRKRYNTLVLHGSFVDNVFTLGKSAQYVRDLWVRDSLRKMGRPAAHGDFYHLYLNGLYWGVYHAGERSDAHWCAEYLGGTASDWDVIDSDGVIDGVGDGWAEILDAIRNESGPEAYQTVARHLDLPAFADYMLVNFYAANTDWPSHNWYAARDRRTDRWQLITWDAEYSFDKPNYNPIPDVEIGPGGDPGDIFTFLIRYPEFVRIFAERMALHSRPGAPLSPDGAEATWMRRASVVEPAIFAEYARWGKYAVDLEGNPEPIALADWQAERDRLRSTWFPVRTRILGRILRANGLLPEVAPPTISPERATGPAPISVVLANTASNAQIFYTTDGTDPRGIDGRPSAAATLYTGPFSVTAPRVVQARGWYDGESSTLVEARYFPGADLRALRLSEVYFNPSVQGQEFIEIQNNGFETLLLDGLEVRQGITYRFPVGTTLASGAVLVLANDTTAFRARFPGVSVAGEFAGNLDNEGESVELWHPEFGVLDSVRYRPHDPWPTGEGSLERRWLPQEWVLLAEPAPGVPPLRRGQPPTPLAAFAATTDPFQLTLGPYDAEHRIFPIYYPASVGYEYALQHSTDLRHWETLRLLPAPEITSIQRTWIHVERPHGYFRLQRQR